MAYQINIVHSFLNCPNAPGVVVPQQVYSPPAARNFAPRDTIAFYDVNTGLQGIYVDRILRRDFLGLHDGSKRLATTDNSQKIALRILWPGYDIWYDHINVLEGAGGANVQYITKNKLAYEVAKKIKQFHRDMSSVRSSEPSPDWWLQNKPLSELILLELRNVSPGSWQPVIVWRCQ